MGDNMNKKVICIGIISMFLLTSLSLSTVVSQSINEVYENSPPDKPDTVKIYKDDVEVEKDILGRYKLKPFAEYYMKTRTNDPDDDQVYYTFSWGDGEYTSWGWGAVDSGIEYWVSHVYNQVPSWSETYKIKVKAKDIHDAESEWSEAVTVILPRGWSKPIISPEFSNILLKILDQSPLFQQLLKL